MVRLACGSASRALPPLQRTFRTVALPGSEVVGVAALASLVMWADEGRKLLARRAAWSPPRDHPE